MTQQIIKFNSGDEIICNVIKDSGEYLSIENQMKIEILFMTLSKKLQRNVLFP